jgi:hypothetical protein
MRIETPSTMKSAMPWIWRSRSGACHVETARRSAARSGAVIVFHVCHVDATAWRTNQAREAAANATYGSTRTSLLRNVAPICPANRTAEIPSRTQPVIAAGSARSHAPWSVIPSVRSTTPATISTNASTASGAAASRTCHIRGNAW